MSFNERCKPNCFADSAAKEWIGRSKYDMDPRKLQQYVQENKQINQRYNDPQITRERAAESYSNYMQCPRISTLASYNNTSQFGNQQNVSSPCEGYTRSLPPYDKKVVVKGYKSAKDLTQQHKEILSSDPNAFHRTLGEFTHQANIRVQKN